MLERRSLKAPITLGVVMIVLIVVLSAVWIVGNLLGAMGSKVHPGLFWAMLATGTVLLGGVLAGVIAYLTLTVKAFNLNRRQSNFIDSVTHELKSPIASLKLYLQTMTRHTVDQQQQAAFHRTMLEDVERLDALISHLLDAARLERGIEEGAENELVRLDQLLAQCGVSACTRYKLPPETVRVESPPITLRSQLVQLEILFRNLIDNAVKYGGTPPHVLVRAEPLGEEQVSVKITDNGAGIPANQRRKVFGRFVRIGNELERSKPGTGLGLYLVRNITRAIGGSVRVRDREQTSGTEFEVTLQGLVAEPAATEETSH